MSLSVFSSFQTVNWLLLDAAREGGVEAMCANPVMRKLVGIRRNLILRHSDALATSADLGLVFDC